MRLKMGMSLLLLGLFLSGCSKPFELAKGSTQSVSLFTVWQRQDDRVEWIRERLEAPVIVAIRPERNFSVEVVEPSGLPSRREWRTHIFLEDLSQNGRIRQTVEKILGKEELEKLAALPAGHRMLRDVWARGQTILILHCKDPEAFRDYLEENGEQLMRSLEATVTIGVAETLYISGEQEGMEQSIRDKYHFSLRIPAGYKVSEDPENKVIRMTFVRYKGPAQFLILHTRPREGVFLDPDWALKFRDALVVLYNEGDHVEFSRSVGWFEPFQGNEAVRLRGLWQNEEYNMGGGFESILFLLEDQAIFMDLAIFNPTGEKLPYMRELRAIASTFRVDDREGDDPL
ncbi:MAG: DUF4837 family protein [Candidatus Eisenbacteria bacterium]|uniref:DUF4837 family protein n=1 Tax=Eiseniibacteriota bacterium TaxID=2212470 RepID=A0A948RT99_UNCEI|nr:DUF4837 family protein [Candidatus Eisenbacteria bacterium]MBU1951210.1 DUF4837 family protein [Candidatus Eisenbacteria bacterium]MBU2690603.1 DUF4837 family protein [Candidatus Eisenbacteria bacterium]